MKALLLPLDDRPVTYVYPQMVAKVAGINPIVPPRALFGSLEHGAKVEAIISWIDTAIAKEQPDALLLCLDTLLYGGLINSRRSDDTVKSVLDKLAALKSWQKNGRTRSIFAQSSIMRISDNYDATEEKAYWARYGREIFAWSSAMHRLKRGDNLPLGLVSSAEMRIPPDIRQDYLATRFRNFQVNGELINLVKQECLSKLVFSLDDSGETGLNVFEKDRLVAMVQEAQLSDRVTCYAGADEVLCTLIASLIVSARNKRPQALLKFSSDEGRDCASRYEGQTIGDTVKAQINACGIDIVPAGAPADFAIIIHANSRQGDHIFLPGLPDLRQIDTSNAVAQTLRNLEETSLPCILCDVAYANGADPLLIDEILNRQHIVSNLLSYSGWNTTGNTSGSALALGIARWSNALDSSENFKRALFVRLADDWAYQANVRPRLEGIIPNSHLLAQMTPYVQRISESLGYNPAQLTTAFPWHRTFETEIDLEPRTAGLVH